MDRIIGAPLNSLENATPEARQRAGTLLVTSFHDQVYRIRAVHATLTVATIFSIQMAVWG